MSNLASILHVQLPRYVRLVTCLPASRPLRAWHTSWRLASNPYLSGDPTRVRREGLFQRTRSSRQVGEPEH